MDKHYNLYYIFLEDKAKNPMNPKRFSEMQKFFENFYKSIKPPGFSLPPTNRRE